MAAIIVDGAKEAAAAMEKCAKNYKKKVDKVLRSEGQKLRTKTRNKAVGTIKTHTGNYLNGITVQKPYKYHLENPSEANDSVKVYGARKTKLMRAGSIGYGPTGPGIAERYTSTGKVRFLSEHTAGGAYHTHFIEYGHVIRRKKKDGEEKKKDGEVEKRTRAFKIYEEARAEYDGAWYAACDRLAEELVREV